MAKIVEITASFGATKQIAAYEPINVHCAIKAEVADGEDVEKATKELYGMARSSVKSQIKEITTTKKSGNPYGLKQELVDAITEEGKRIGLTDEEIDATLRARDCKTDYQAQKTLMRMKNQESIR